MEAEKAAENRGTMAVALNNVQSARLIRIVMTKPPFPALDVGMLKQNPPFSVHLVNRKIYVASRYRKRNPFRTYLKKSSISGQLYKENP